MNANISPLSPYELNPNYQNLSGANRLERALAIFSKSHDIKKVAPNSWTVKSQMGFVSYLVQKNGEEWNCTCPDHIKNGCECKHILAVKKYLESQEINLHVKKEQAEAQGKVFRDWNNYTLAQMNESELFPIYLKELVSLVNEPARVGAGRPAVPLAEQIYMAVSKVASMRSSRRAYGEIVDAEKAGHISKQYNYNEVNLFMNKPEATPILRELLRASAQPLAEIEHIFAIDASGFGTYQFGDWLDDKWSADNKRKHTYVKAHVACGVISNVITDAIVTPSNVADMNQLKSLLDGTKGRFVADEVLADKGYLSNENYRYIKEAGAKGYIDFKENVTGRGCPAWREAFLNFLQHRDEFYDHYHKRSNVETVFGAIKAKYQEKLKSKKEVAQINELYCKMIAYNISVVIRMAYEKNIEVMFK